MISHELESAYQFHENSYWDFYRNCTKFMDWRANVFIIMNLIIHEHGISFHLHPLLCPPIKFSSLKITDHIKLLLDIIYIFCIDLLLLWMGPPMPLVCSPYHTSVWFYWTVREEYEKWAQKRSQSFSHVTSPLRASILVCTMENMNTCLAGFPFTCYLHYFCYTAHQCTATFC